MTDDLVKRLRNNCSCNFSSTPCGAEEECRNAFEGADRIEKLEAALLWYAEHCQKGGDDIEGPYGDYGQRARKALEGKDD